MVAGVVGTAAMTVSSTLEAKLRGREPSTTPARAAVAHWGCGTGWGAAPPAPKWGATEVAIDLWHHIVYATVTGLAYPWLE